MKKIYTVLRPGFESFFMTFALLRITSLSTTNFITLLLFVFIYISIIFLDRKTAIDGRCRKDKKEVFILGTFFTILYLAGSYETIYSGLTNTLFRIIILFISAIGLLFLFYKGIRIAFIIFDYLGVIRDGMVSKRTVWLTFPICLLCFIPYFLMNMPGIMTADSFNQYAQVIGIWQYSNHHPWIHTQLISLFYHIGLFFTNNTSIALSFYTVFQMVFMISCITYFISSLRKMNVSRGAIYLVIAFYALVPYHAIYSVSMWKDTIFAGVTLILTVTLLRIIYQQNVLKIKKNLWKEWIIFGFSGIAFCLFRSNGWYAFLLITPFILLTFRKNIRMIISLQAVVICIVLMIKGPVMDYYEVEQPDILESLAIPMQQISRIIVNDEEMTKEQSDFFAKVMDTSCVEELYDPGIADGFKTLVRNGDLTYFTTHLRDFFEIYIEIGMKYPLDYMIAYKDQTIGYWFPSQSGIIAGNAGIIDNDYGIHDISVLKGNIPAKFLEIQLKLKDIIPGYGILWSAGSIFWLMLLSAVYLLLLGKKKYIMVYLPGFAILITLLIATPVADDFRYAYPYVFCFPVYLLIPMLKTGREPSIHKK